MLVEKTIAKNKYQRSNAELTASGEINMVVVLKAYFSTDDDDESMMKAAY